MAKFHRSAATPIRFPAAAGHLSHGGGDRPARRARDIYYEALSKDGAAARSTPLCPDATAWSGFMSGGGLKEVAGSQCLIEFVTLMVASVSAAGLHFLKGAGGSREE